MPVLLIGTVPACNCERYEPTGQAHVFFEMGIRFMSFHVCVRSPLRFDLSDEEEC